MADVRFCSIQAELRRLNRPAANGSAFGDEEPPGLDLGGFSRWQTQAEVRFIFSRPGAFVQFRGVLGISPCAHR